MKCPFIDRVPTDIVENLKFRASIHRKVMDNREYTQYFWEACAADPLFYICAFGYTHDARAEPFKKLPFILYDFQRKAFLEILDAINHHDLLIKKSRDMGASWMCALAFEWMWHFTPKLSAPSFLIGSRVKEYVDHGNNPKSIFWKLDFFHDNLPKWLMPPGYDRAIHRRVMHMTNPHNGAVIDGETTTANFAAGDRRTAIMLDEFAKVDQGHKILPATRDVTKSRIFNSTPLGINNAYFDVHETNIKKLTLFWTDHPIKQRGLYTTGKDGRLKVLIRDGYPKNYCPILDGNLRSPAFDYEESRSSPREMAQEWNMDFRGSGDQFFSAAAIQEVTRKNVIPPLFTGDLDYDTITAEPTRFRRDVGGKRGSICLWRLLDSDGNIFRDKHEISLGADVSAGTGASNSALCAYDVVTNEKILEYASPYVRPEEFAKQAVAIATWLGGAYLIWESNGPGRQFGSRVQELHYGNIYLRKREEKLSKKVTDIPGWASTKEGKLDLVGEYRAAVEEGRCINRSRDAMEECLEYIYDPNGGVSHSRAANKEDASGAKFNHGDRVLADALAWRGVIERTKKPKKEKPTAPIGSLAWRIEQRELHKQQTRPGRELPSEGW